MNIFTKATVTPDNDPLGLSELAELKPETGSMEKDWKAVSAALDAGDRHRRQWWIGGLAAAATVALVLLIGALPQIDPGDSTPGQEFATETGVPESKPLTDKSSTPRQSPTTDELIAMSQKMERQLHLIRTQVGSMPSELVVYQVEFQDLIGQVDEALSMSPDSQALWGQRLGLQMDLMKLYRNQLRRDYHRMASV